jgi:uncharacterized protein (TIGR00296 family)
MFDIEAGIQLVKFARGVVESYVKEKQFPLPDMLPDFFNQELGVFVTLHTFPTRMLRGCIGIPKPTMKLKDALIKAAQSATKDPRFPQLLEKELDRILVEVTVLTKPALIKVKNPKDYLSQIKIGRDGLIVELGWNQGLLLPQVPVEQGWDKEEFLSQTCMKAGLVPDAWFDEDIQIYKFSGQVFSESMPNGAVERKL